MPESQPQQSLIAQTAELVASGRPLSVLFEQLCDLLSTHFPISVVFVALAQSDGTTRVEYALDHGIRRYPGLTVADHSTTTATMRTGLTISRATSADWLGHARFPLRGEDPSADDSVSAVFVPILTGKRPIGVLSVQSNLEHAYEPADVALIEQIAELLAEAIRTQRPTLHGERRSFGGYTGTIVAALIGLTIAIIASLVVATNSSRAEALDEQRSRSAMIAHSLGDVFDEAREIAANLGATVPLVTKTKPAISRLTKQLLDAAPGTSIDGVGTWWEPYAFDPHVRLFAPYAARIAIGKKPTRVRYGYATARYDYLHRAFYRQGIHARDVALTAPYAEGGYVFIGAVTAIVDRTNKPIGVASADIFAGDFPRTLGLDMLPNDIFAYVTTNDGHLIATSDDRDLRRFSGTKAGESLLSIAPTAIEPFVQRRLGTHNSALLFHANPEIVLHFVQSDVGLFARANGLRGAAIVVIAIIWGLGGVMLVLDLRRHRGGRRTQYLEREKRELENEIAERQHAEERLRRFAFYDSLTNLPNRAFLIEHLTRSLERARSTESPFAVLYIDLDRFKIVNDSLGHAVGDELLVAVARRLESTLHANDIVARIGGDEFVVVLHQAVLSDHARSVAQRIVERMSEPFEVRGSELYTGASIGIIANATDYASPSDLLRDSDIAMYEAKSQGKDRFVLFDRALHTRTVEQLRLETDLRGAVERGEFVLRYQPIVELANGRLSGFEALIRWQHPERGLLGPSDFIAMSEQNRSIVRLGAWVAREAVREFCTWGRNDLTIAVNVSVWQLVQNNYASDIAAILIAAGMDARAFKVEITESALMEDVAISERALRELRELGVQAHIDDFGTGYSSLSYLRRFPIESIKIDRSFVAEMTFRPEAFEIVRTIVTLATTLGMTVTAEGIETADQLAACRSLGITYGQGFYIAYPLEPAEAAENAKRSLPASFAR